MADLPVPQSPPSIPDLIRRYLNGTPVPQLASDAGVSMATIYNWIHSKSADPDIVKQVLVTRFAKAEQRIEQATDQLELARARELNNNAKWHLERAVREFNPKSEVQQDTTIRVIIEPSPSQLRRQQPQVIDSNVVNIMDAEISG